MRDRLGIVTCSPFSLHVACKRRSHLCDANKLAAHYITLFKGEEAMKLTGAVLVVLLAHASAFSPVARPRSARASTALQMASDVPDSKRVVVTGLGVISGCGIGADDFWQACLDGKSSLDKVKRFDISAYPCQIASEVPDDMFVAADHFSNPKNARSNDRYTHFAVAAARQALKDGGVGDTPETLEHPDRLGVMVGSAFGGMETFEKETLKLAAKPDRPKVRCCEPVYVF